MSRKDYRIIAAALKDTNAPYAICLHMAKTLATDNPAFKTHVFLTACGH